MDDVNAETRKIESCSSGHDFQLCKSRAQHQPLGTLVILDLHSTESSKSAHRVIVLDVGARVSWSAGFGTRPAGATEAPQIRIVRGDGADPLGGMGGLDNPGKRYGLEFFVQVYNLLNHMNATGFSGVLTSPFFGQPTAAAPPRRVEVGTRVSF
jgi:hypothetical protein